MDRPARRTLLIYYAHTVRESTARELARLSNEVPDSYTILVAGYCENNATLQPLGTARVGTMSLTRNDLEALPYPTRQRAANWATLRQSSDLVPLYIFRTWPDYTHYWLIEYDVRYTGHWGHFFDEMDTSDADLMCPRFGRYVAGNTWQLWDTLFTGSVAFEKERRVSGFLPLARASQRMLAGVDRLCCEGWGGHPEVLWPCAAIHNAFELAQIGGRGQFTPHRWRDRFSGKVSAAGFPNRASFVDNPPLRDTMHLAAFGENMLWHPVKG
jgi:hypothetical protein